MVNMDDVEVTWADDEDGPKVYLTLPVRSVVLSRKEAEDLAGWIQGCLYAIRWHVAAWVIVSTWGKSHVTEKVETDDFYVAADTAICGRQRPDEGWRSEYPVVTLEGRHYNLCRLCERAASRRVQ